ncbi:potassium channel family protein [Microaerobacter geothermalis]|uniref:potassium channel family protein n=1 Tax=Microaerobacter geothermalis TaxID=674972 RepID=UPI001F398111|nr:potassium channel family protein [Microaerobacter geothermalis]MCF6094032.1 potassium channel family protein [Microaerobacter geothermalis]
MKLIKPLYEVFIILLVITYIILIFTDTSQSTLLTKGMLIWFDWGLISFFALEYLIRLYRAEKKWQFVKENWFDLIAMIPFDAFFRAARIMRIVRLIRIIRTSPFLRGLLGTREIQMILIVTSFVILWTSFGVYLLEKDINSSIQTYGDALWWAIVTTTTVGYGDIFPSSDGGRIFAVLLMFTGIGLIGTLTANIASHLTQTLFKHELGKKGNESKVHFP